MDTEANNVNELVRHQHAINAALSRFLGGEQDASGVIRTLLEDLRASFGARRVYIYELNREHTLYYCSYDVREAGKSCYYADVHTVSVSTLPLLTAQLEEGHILWIDGADASARVDTLIRTTMREQGLSTAVMMPMTFSGVLSGLIGIDLATPVTRFTHEIEQWLEVTGRLISISLELRYRQMEAELHTSDMTNLFAYMPLGYIRLQLRRNEAGVPCDFRVMQTNSKWSELTGLRIENLMQRWASEYSKRFAETLQALADVLDDGCYRTFNQHFDDSGKECHIILYSTHPDEVVALFLDITEMIRARCALSRSELLFKNIFDNISAGVEIYDTEGRLTDLNPKDMEIFGVKQKVDVYGLSLFSNPNIPENVRRQLREQDVVDFYTDYSFDRVNDYFKTLRGTDSSVKLYTKASKMYDEEKRFCGYMLISLDNTKQLDTQKRINDFEQFFSLISDYGKVGYARYNLINYKGYAIKQWYKNLGECEDVPLAQVAGVYRHMHPEDRVPLLRFFERARAGLADSFSSEMRVARGGSSSAWNWIHVHLVVNCYKPEQREIEVVCVNYDITELKETQAKLTEARDRAEEADRLKTAFLANMSHEIRTPLNAIVGFSGLVCQAESDEERAQYHQIIEQNSNLLLQLVSDILDLSAVEAGTMEFSMQPINPSAFCADLVHSLQGKTQPGVELLVDGALPDCRLMSDPNRLQQVLTNFISNAIKFTHQGSIRVGCRLGEGERIRFYVADTGIGIPPEKQQAVFERFVKVDSFVQGTGLGLPLCQSIIRHLGGEIGLESQPGKGSTFWFTLPIGGEAPLS